MSNATTPLVSVCLPTYNRADLLDLCLTRLADLNRVDLQYEIVVSDNCSTDETADVVRSHASTLQRLSYQRMKQNNGPLLNWHNAVRHATGEFVTYLGDDDRLIPEGLVGHLDVMRRRPELVATYADWISFDDEREVELNRYYSFLKQRAEFDAQSRFQALDFILNNQVLPETGILRRGALLRALPFVKVGYPYLQYLYQMLRQGTIAFDLVPFYVENRVVKAHLDRGNWQGMGLWLVNDEMRTSIEMIVLRAFQDSGFPTIPDERRAQIREFVEVRLQQRYQLEALVARLQGNFILASELQRRWTLWQGTSQPLDMQTEIDQVVVPAALQAIKETFESTSSTDSVAFHGFKTPDIPDAFADRYPSIPVAHDTPAAWEAFGRAKNGHLHVMKTEADLRGLPIQGNVVLFERLIDFYQTTSFNIGLGAI